MKRHRLLPAISVFSVLFLLTGEFFNCCRINEAFAEDVEHFIQSLGLAKQANPVASTSEDPDHESHCHGHAGLASSIAEHDALPAHTMFTLNESCLSDLAITKKSMVGSESFTLSIPSAIGVVIAEPLSAQSVSVDRPRPQNRSSPPVYLLTLRILV